MCAGSCLNTFSATPEPTTSSPTADEGATVYPLDASEQDKFIRVLYSKFTTEWVTQKPGEWIGLAQTSCVAYDRNGNGDPTTSNLLDVLEEQLSAGASRWLLATATTLVCPNHYVD